MGSRARRRIIDDDEEETTSSSEEEEDEWRPPGAGAGAGGVVAGTGRRAARRIASSSSEEEEVGEVEGDEVGAVAVEEDSFVSARSASTRRSGSAPHSDRGDTTQDISDGEGDHNEAGSSRDSFVLVKDSLEVAESVTPTPGTECLFTDDEDDDVIGPSPPTSEDEDDRAVSRSFRKSLTTTPTSRRSGSSSSSSQVQGKPPGRGSSKSKLSPAFCSSSAGEDFVESQFTDALPIAGSSKSRTRSPQSPTKKQAGPGGALPPRPPSSKSQRERGRGEREEQQQQGDPNKQRKFGIVMTSTPVVAGSSKKFMSSDLSSLNMTAIPRREPQFNMSLDEVSEDLQKTVPADVSTSRNWRDTQEIGDSSEDRSGGSDDTRRFNGAKSTNTQKKNKKGDRRSGNSSSSGIYDGIEDIINAGVEKISLAGTKKGLISKKIGAHKNAPSVGATSANYYDEEEEEEPYQPSPDISANFDLDDDDDSKEDSSIQVVFDDNHRAKASSSSSSDDIQVLTEKLQKLPLDKKKPMVANDQPRKAIFLNEPPPIERKTYSYDPTNAKQEEFYGDVRRTVTMMAKSIEDMPLPEDEEDLDAYLPTGLVPLYDHQKYGLRWLLWRESQFPGGGILADEMGLGKTIMIIALILKSKMDSKAEKGKAEKENWVDQDVGNCIPSKATLVVCPMGCLLQWSEEIASKGRGLRTTMFYGSNKPTSAAQLAQSDVVLTTYGTIGSDQSLATLRRIYWKRIVLDESHNIRNPKTHAAVNVNKLAARHRWAVTGTPVHNTPQDFYSIVKFLKMVPFDDSKVWDNYIGLKKLRASEEARQRMHVIATTLILRRTKEEVHQAGGNVRAIPPKTVEVIKVELSEEERIIYDHLMKFSKQMFADFMKKKEIRQRELQGAAFTYTAGGRKKGKNLDTDVPGDIKFSHLFALIMRLRQCAVLPALIKTMLEDEEVDKDDSFDENLDEHIVSKRNPAFDDRYESAKIKKILEDLEQLRSEAENEGRAMDKVVIVSTWRTLLEKLNNHLKHRRFSSIYITGKEGSDERRDAQKAFNRPERRPQICLLTLQAGGVGINLVGGNHVFFIEPHWNPQLELQAQDRVHRFGQEKSVSIRRYITTETIEERVMGLQEMKKDLADGVLNSRKVARGGGMSFEQMRHLFDM